MNNVIGTRQETFIGLSVLFVNHTQIHSQWKDEVNEKGEAHVALNTYFSAQRPALHTYYAKYKKRMYFCELYVGACIQINGFTKRHLSNLLI